MSDEATQDERGGSTQQVFSFAVLFDEAHGQLLSSQAQPDHDEDTDTWKKLEALGAAIRPCSSALDDGVLHDQKVLIIAAPTSAFSPSEIEAIAQFVREGGGILIAANAEAIWRQKQLGDGTLDRFNALTESLGIRFEQYFNVPPDVIRDFEPHYLTSEVSELTAWDVSAVMPLAQDYYPLARFTAAGDLFAVGWELGKGRIVAAGDFVFLGDRDFEKASNRQFVCNVLRWLAAENPIDCLDVKVEREILLGKRGTASITLRNPQSKRLERIRCRIESNAGAGISEPVVRIRSISPGEQIWLPWSVEPKRLGKQSLKLTIKWRCNTNQVPLSLDCFVEFRFAEFRCIAPATLELRAVDTEGIARDEFTLNQPFIVEGQVQWRDVAQAPSVTTDLKYPRSKLRLIRRENVNGVDRWHLEAIKPGDYRLIYRVVESEQACALSVRISESLEDQIANIHRDDVEPLDAEALRLTTRIRREFSALQDIPFRLLAHEKYVQEVYPSEESRRLLSALAAARREEMQNLPLLKELLVNLAPMYSPKGECYVPFDPKLARQWADLHPLLEENILQNFAYIDDYDTSWLRQNLAAYILHEKYGHGFFYTQTRLGQQLAILYRHGLLRKADAKHLPFPYPRQFYEDEHGRRAFEALSHSAIILNEGFAAWVELQILPQMSAEIQPAAYRRKVFLMDKDQGLDTIAKKSVYFKRFTNFQRSRYQEGYDWLSFVQDYFDEPWASKCAVQVAVKAADIHLGITEVNGTIQFGMSARDMERALLEDERDDARCDMRLRHIHTVLREHQEQLRVDQRRLLCHQECLHPDCPVNAIIAEKFKW
jgi:hypothetical protein